MPLACDKAGAKVLDLGAGVGRNTIPLAQYIATRGGEVVAVDLLDSAIEGLNRYALQFGVLDTIQSVCSDIEYYGIEESSYDYIVAVSALEHLSSVERLRYKLAEISRGVKPGGIFCLIMGTNIRETDEISGEELDPMFELNLSLETALRMLRAEFDDWETLKQQDSHQRYSIQRQDKPVMLACDSFTFAVRKQA
jgi:2-polyprenyl-3-methyl-5-hydroxy-6-metoxy-1,4-benzoquinol methylase